MVVLSSRRRRMSTLRRSFLLGSIYMFTSQIFYLYYNTHHRVGLPQSNLRALLKLVEEKEDKAGLDFFIMGWPKTGTSALMKYLNSSDELKIVPKPTNTKNLEFHIINEEDIDLLFNEIKLARLIPDKDGKRYGIKWPGAISGKGLGAKSIKLIETYNPEGTDTKIFVGIRHPVRWFESFYNFRHGGRSGTPSTTSLIGNERKNWHGIYTDRARFEEGIMQLGKVPLRQKDKIWIENHKGYGLIDGGTPYKVFLYSGEQLSDDDKERKGVFLEEMSSFLELKEPFTIDNDVPRSNVSQHKGIDICDPEHQPVREELVRNGEKTAQWIRSNLAEAEGFVLPNKEHFLSIVDTFGTDPCDNKLLIS